MRPCAFRAASASAGCSSLVRSAPAALCAVLVGDLRSGLIGHVAPAGCLSVVHVRSASKVVHANANAKPAAGKAQKKGKKDEDSAYKSTVRLPQTTFGAGFACRAFLRGASEPQPDSFSVRRSASQLENSRTRAPQVVAGQEDLRAVRLSGHAVSPDASRDSVGIFAIAGVHPVLATPEPLQLSTPSASDWVLRQRCSPPRSSPLRTPYVEGSG